MKLVRKLVLFGGAYAGWKYLFDPNEGGDRRARLQEQFATLTRGGPRDQTTSDALEKYGTGRSSAGSSADTTPTDDETLKEKIESEVLRREEWPKGRLNIDVLNGVVTLRGELDSEDRRTQLEQEIRKVSGVVEIENLVHLPSTPAPNKADALEASRRAEKEKS